MLTKETHTNSLKGPSEIIYIYRYTNTCTHLKKRHIIVMLTKETHTNSSKGPSEIISHTDTTWTHLDTRWCEERTYRHSVIKIDRHKDTHTVWLKTYTMWSRHIYKDTYTHIHR
jgi:hypothetical protein